MAARSAKTITSNELALRDSMWPDAEARLWDRKAAGGFVTVPKTMPLLERMMDEMSKNFPVSSTYAALWAHTWDNNAFVRLNKPDELAFAAGFTGQRGVRTLHDRLRRLEALGFIEIRAAGNNKTAFVYLPNPHEVIFALHDLFRSTTAPAEEKAKVQGLQEASWVAFLARAQEIGCNDVKALLAARSAKAKPAEPAAAKRPRIERAARAPTKLRRPRSGG